MLTLTLTLALLVILAAVAAVRYSRRLKDAEGRESEALNENRLLQAKVDAADRERAQAVEAVEERHRAVLETERGAHTKQLEQLHVATDEKVKLLAGNREEFTKDMKAIAGEVTTQATQQFRQLAEESRKTDRAAASGELKAARKDFEKVIAPVAEKLGAVEKEVRTLEEERKRTEGEVAQMMKNMISTAGELRLEVGQLSTALKRPNVRGNWGEMQLKNVVRAAGMTEHVDFHSQPTLGAGPDGRLRPDMTVHLPSERDIVVDSKVPLDAYLDAAKAHDDLKVQGQHLDRHAKQVRSHIDKLGAKRYHEQLETQAEIVVCFLPNEAVYCAALDRDPGLLEYGVTKRVLIATPTTLLALLHACNYGWRQVSIEESARAIAEAGRELHRRVGKFLNEFAKTGRLLGQTVNAYNSSVGSAEGRMLPELRRMAEAGADSGRELPEIAPLDTPVRMITAPEAKEPREEPRQLPEAGEAA
jgi:DNA recombination protein RmuC